MKGEMPTPASSASVSGKLFKMLAQESANESGLRRPRRHRRVPKRSRRSLPSTSPSGQGGI